MKKIGVVFIVLSASFCATAQPQLDAYKQKLKDSIVASHADQAALLYPRIRQFSITHEVNTTGTISAKLYGQDFFKGRFQSSRTTINMNVPLIDQPKNLLVGSLGVVHQFFSISNVVSYKEQMPVSPIHVYIPMISTGISYTRRDSVWNRPLTFTATVTGLFDPAFSKRQFTFNGLVTFPLFRNENTRLMGGLIIAVDPSSPFPAFLLLSYFHKFKSLDMDLMIDMPYRAALRKPIRKRASLTAFSELAGSNSFFKFENPNPTLPEKMRYSSLEIKSGLLYEYRLTKKLVFSMSGGIAATVKSVLLEQGAKPNDYFIKNKNSAVPYGQIGLSLLPFWRPFHETR